MTEDEWEEVRNIQARIIRGSQGDSLINVRISSRLFDQIIAQAKRRDRSVAAMVAMLLREAIQSREIVQRGPVQ